MRLEDANTGQEFWTAMIEHAMMRDQSVITVTASPMTDGAAAERAKRQISQ